MVSIIIAAGKQSRFKSDVPKALAKLDNGEVLAVHNYNMLKRLGDVYIAVSDENKVYFKEYFNDILSIFLGEDVSIIKKSGKTNAGRDYVYCTLA